MVKAAHRITMTVLDKDEYLKNIIEIGLDRGWKAKRRYFDKRAKAQGFYVLFVRKPIRIIYVGKTRGPTMDFATRLYRHATIAASRNSKVYRALKGAEQETGGPILASLVTTEQIRRLFDGEKLGDEAMIDAYEQVLIHLLKPEIQE